MGGVMAIAKLVEMRHVARMRANFTEADVEKIRPFDPELARKAQIAVDHKLPVNFQQLELIEESLPRLLEEKKQLRKHGRQWLHCQLVARTSCLLRWMCPLADRFQGRRMWLGA